MAIKRNTHSIWNRCPYRNRSVVENLTLFEAMKMVIIQGSHVLRAKIDMSSANMLMRDPLMYRVLHRHHHRTETTGRFILCMISLMVRVIILNKFRILSVR
jgi:glutamyl/glutaminyl-tRNA synthetase